MDHEWIMNRDRVQPMGEGGEVGGLLRGSFGMRCRAVQWCGGAHAVASVARELEPDSPSAINSATLWQRQT